jgi:hypothetical protein
MRPIWLSIMAGNVGGLATALFLALILDLNVLWCLGLFQVCYYVYAGFLLYNDRAEYEAHVPETLEEAAERVVELCGEQEVHSPLLVAQTAEQFVAMCHQGLGRWMRNSWGLWSRASKLYADIHSRYGLEHADDLSGMILLAAWHGAENTDPTEALKMQATIYLQHWKDFERFTK